MQNQLDPPNLESQGKPDGAVTLTKHHGLGNDFLIAVDPARSIGSAEAALWCDRHIGVGADGLIVADPVDTDVSVDPGGPVTGRSDSGGAPRHWRMVLFNADGSRAEISGNGIRCLGQAIADHLGIDRSTDQELHIETDAGPRTLVIKSDPSGRPGPEAMVRAGMGKAVDGPGPSARWEEAGVAVMAQRGVDIGNPHIVGFVDQLAGADMAAIGPVIEADYPSGVNVHLVSVTDDRHLDLLVWERGVGVTRACGSGACAAAWAANSAGLTGPLVTVTMPGGSATVELSSGEVFLTGPATRVAEVVIDG